MKKTEYYYKDDNDKKVFLSEHRLDYSYFQIGYPNEENKGVLSTTYFGAHGTTLTPVFKDGKSIIRPEFGGVLVHETNFLKH